MHLLLVGYGTLNFLEIFVPLAIQTVILITSFLLFRHRLW
jgi:hypothetical protein